VCGRLLTGATLVWMSRENRSVMYRDPVGFRIENRILLLTLPPSPCPAFINSDVPRCELLRKLRRQPTCQHRALPYQ
jgi:hypothetical protein